MNCNIKYKQITRLMLFGGDDVNTSTNSQYSVYPSTIHGIAVNNGGTHHNASYTQIKVMGGGGSSAVATATVSGGAITAFNVTNSVIDFTGQPAITITSGIVNTTSLVDGTGYIAAIHKLLFQGKTKSDPTDKKNIIEKKSINKKAN